MNGRIPYRDTCLIHVSSCIDCAISSVRDGGTDTGTRLKVARLAVSSPGEEFDELVHLIEEEGLFDASEGDVDG
jgi:hypothetical protein